jgi:hypothetical protein
MATAPAGSASLSDILTAAKNLVTALNNAADAYLSVNGKSTLENITVPTIVKATPGRVASVSIIVSGSSTGYLYDANNLTNTTAPLWIIPETSQPNGEPYVVNMPTNTGLICVPGTGQSVTVNWS